MEDANGRTTAREQLRRRSAVLRALAEERPRADGAHSRVLADALREFGGERELVLAVQQRWQVTLLARLDQVIERDPDDLHGAVVAAVGELSRALPGFAVLLSRHADDPVLAAAWRRLAGYVDQACACGRPHPIVVPARTARRAARTTRRCAVLRAGAAMARRLFGPAVEDAFGSRPMCRPALGG
jgi:hypothetical protein